MSCHSENITVAVRIRPVLPFDVSQTPGFDPLSFTSLKSLQSDKSYEFDRVYSTASTTQRLFDEVCESRVWRAMDGFNCSFLCYGATASGKSFTMCGKKKAPGIVPLAIQTIFSYIEETPTKEFLLRCSYCEVYNECINDLLNPLNCNLPIMDDKNVGNM
jgi:centromeric protein E